MGHGCFEALPGAHAFDHPTSLQGLMHTARGHQQAGIGSRHQPRTLPTSAFGPNFRFGGILAASSTSFPDPLQSPAVAPFSLLILAVFGS